jgi:hypothetical protein
MEFGLEQSTLHKVGDLRFRPTIILHFAEKKQVDRFESKLIIASMRAPNGPLHPAVPL